ncbi:hypothetical protein [Kitasatospora sp. NPDC094011]|uniref:Lsr2 family DNA-binding protein n=1 Tax=Kitasatospora sp. NPDC094011 TaxID=3364090 RepID=UPI0038183917
MVRSAASKSGPDASAVRAWAKGMEVNDRGAIPKHVVDAYLKANARQDRESAERGRGFFVSRTYQPTTEKGSPFRYRASPAAL